MNYYDHSTLSVRKFGGVEEDYLAIHKFLDSSKLFYHHARHRLLLHNTYGIHLCILKFREYITNRSGQVVMVRDIAAEHCKEDLSGRVPTLNDWLGAADPVWKEYIQVPHLKNEALESFVLMPMLMSGLTSGLIITCSNFGLFLVHEILGVKQAKLLGESLDNILPINTVLQQFQYSANWQFTPDPKEINWLINHKKTIDEKKTIYHSVQ